MLLRIIILIIALLALPDVYIYNMYIKRWTARLWLRLLWLVPSLALAIVAVAIIRSDDMLAEHQAWVSYYMFAFLATCAPKTLFMLFDSLGHLVNWIVTRGAPQGSFFREGIFIRIMRIMGMSTAMFGLALLSFGYLHGRHHYVIHRRTIFFDDLPPQFDGYKVAQFSDMHIGTLRDGHEQDARAIVDIINQQHCDAVMFIGDLVNHESSELDGFRRDLSRLHAPDGVYAVMGNHDYSMYLHYNSEKERMADVRELQRRVRSYGWTLLLNEHRILRRGEDSLVIAGTENDGMPPFPSLADMPKTMCGLQRNCFTILLSHDPTAWRRKILKTTGVQLTLSGHTHAGQFYVFGWSPVAGVYKEWTGAYSIGGRWLNVSNGIGAVMFPFRYGAWPEVNVITLRRKQDTKERAAHQGAALRQGITNN